MLEVLNFVRAAVCKNDLQPTLLHFRIKDGTITGYNGVMAIRCPLPVGLDCAPHAMQFIRAIKACKDEAVIMKLEGGKLLVKSGKFKTAVDIAHDPTRFPELEPDGEKFPIRQPVLPMLKKLLPFVGTDPARPHLCGVLFVNNSVYATNNVSIVEHYSPAPFPVIANLPTEAIRELLRLNLEPIAVQADEKRVTFHLQGNAWISANLMAGQWPDVARLFAEVAGVPAPPLGPNLLDAVAKIVPFADERGSIYFHNGEVSTAQRGIAGTSVETDESPGVGCHRSSILLGLRGVADRVGWDAYPRPVPFYGDKLRGVFLGYHVQEVVTDEQREAMRKEHEERMRHYREGVANGTINEDDIPF